MKFIYSVIERIHLNQLSDSIGLRPIGESNARIAEMMAWIAQNTGESPDVVSERLEEAMRERKLDGIAQKFINRSKFSLCN